MALIHLTNRRRYRRSGRRRALAIGGPVDEIKRIHNRFQFGIGGRSPIVHGQFKLIDESFVEPDIFVEPEGLGAHFLNKHKRVETDPAQHHWCTTRPGKPFARKSGYHPVFRLVGLPLGYFVFVDFQAKKLLSGGIDRMDNIANLMAGIPTIGRRALEVEVRVGEDLSLRRYRAPHEQDEENRDEETKHGDGSY